MKSDLFPIAAAALLFLAACGDNARNRPDTQSAQTRVAEVPDRGRQLFGACATCHSLGPDAAHRVGPNLWGIVGAPAARHPDFAYSRAMERSGIFWTPAALGAYLENPQAYVTGTRMAYSGMKSEADRKVLIGWLAERR